MSETVEAFKSQQRKIAVDRLETEISEAVARFIESNAQLETLVSPQKRHYQKRKQVEVGSDGQAEAEG